MRFPEPVAYAIALSEVVFGTRELRYILDVSVVISVYISCLTSVHANLFVCYVVIPASRPGTSDVGTVFAVITNITPTKAIEAVSVTRAVVDTVEEIKVPHVVFRESGPCVNNGEGLLLKVASSPE